MYGSPTWLPTATHSSIARSFLSNAPEKHSMAWMYPSLHIHSPPEGLLGCLQGQAVMNEATVNVCVQVSVQTSVFNSFGPLINTKEWDCWVVR